MTLLQKGLATQDTNENLEFRRTVV